MDFASELASEWRTTHVAKQKAEIDRATERQSDRERGRREWTTDVHCEAKCRDRQSDRETGQTNSLTDKLE